MTYNGKVICTFVFYPTNLVLKQKLEQGPFNIISAGTEKSVKRAGFKDPQSYRSRKGPIYISLLTPRLLNERKILLL